MNLIIRNYEEKDFSSLRTLMVLLQDAEKLVEPDRLIGEEMDDKYLRKLEERSATGKAIQVII